MFTSKVKDVAGSALGLETPPIVKAPKPFITAGFIQLIVATAITFVLRNSIDGLTKIVGFPYNALGSCISTIKKIPAVGSVLSVPFKILQTVFGIPLKIVQFFAGSIKIIFIVLAVILVITLILKIVSRINYLKSKKAYSLYHRGLHKILNSVVNNSKRVNSMMKKSLSKQKALEQKLQQQNETIKIKRQNLDSAEGSTQQGRAEKDSLKEMSLYE